MRAKAKTNTRVRGASIVVRRLAGIEDDGADLDAGVFIEDRSHMVAEAASARAQRRGSVEGFDLDDWLAAEDEVDQGTGYRCHARARKSLN